MERASITEESALNEVNLCTSHLLRDLEMASMPLKIERDGLQTLEKEEGTLSLSLERERETLREVFACADPNVSDAREALASLHSSDGMDLKSPPLSPPVETVRLLFDCVGLLLGELLERVQMASEPLSWGTGKHKTLQRFLTFSFTSLKGRLMGSERGKGGGGLLSRLSALTQVGRDSINPDTEEFLAVYLDVGVFHPMLQSENDLSLIRARRLTMPDS
jgi:hypothetical protein